MITKTTRYNTCPSCKALNMAYRNSCYKCAKPITPTVMAVAPVAKEVVLEERRRSKRFDIYAPGWVIDAAGDKKKAEHYFTQLARLTKDADGDRPELREVRQRVVKP